MKIFLVVIAQIWAIPVFAETFSASHFGFALENNKIVGLTQAGGSMVVLDWGKKLGPDFSFGLKTLANGAQNENATLFRLTSGPAVHYRWDGFEIHYALGYFQESSTLKSMNDIKAESDGVSHILALQRYTKWMNNVDLGWGSYYSLSYGRIDSDLSSRSTTQRIQWLSGRNYQSSSQGIYCSLRVSL